ncbi:MAG TPA: SDR family oxidoreductase [Gemmatimonadales bacterium]|nr:SDR family oxidoreductase [Gemmatimonadales bacterium]
MTGGRAAGRPGGRVLIAGATSRIAQGIAAGFARRGYEVLVAGRDLEETGRIAADLAVRYGVRSRALAFDATDFSSHQRFADALFQDGAGLTGIVVCFGLLGDQATAAGDPLAARRIVDVNFTGAATLLAPIANHLERQGHGFIAALGSVAGDRGRQSNYIYGSAKGALALYLQGLRQRLSKHNVTVTTIKPGFVDTRMTYGMPGLFLVADPADIGERAVKAILAGKRVVYLPWFWRFIMLIIRSIPESIFMRLKL